MDYTKEYLQRFIDDQIEEGGEMEYKAAGSLSRDNASTEEMTKDVSAFASAAGGLLVYGIAEYKDRAKRHCSPMIRV